MAARWSVGEAATASIAKLSRYFGVKGFRPPAEGELLALMQGIGPEASRLKSLPQGWDEATHSRQGFQRSHPC